MRRQRGAGGRAVPPGALLTGA
ncbi:MAG: hypothetical protein RL375_474, partial [Pseudomonadota bacterium]